MSQKVHFTALRDAMRECGYTVTRVADELLGISESSFIRLLNGEKKITVEEVLLLGAAFDIPLNNYYPVFMQPYIDANLNDIESTINEVKATQKTMSERVRRYNPKD